MSSILSTDRARKEKGTHSFDVFWSNASTLFQNSYRTCQKYSDPSFVRVDLIKREKRTKCETVEWIWRLRICLCKKERRDRDRQQVEGRENQTFAAMEHLENTDLTMQHIVVINSISSTNKMNIVKRSNGEVSQLCRSSKHFDTKRSFDHEHSYCVLGIGRSHSMIDESRRGYLDGIDWASHSHTSNAKVIGNRFSLFSSACQWSIRNQIVEHRQSSTSHCNESFSLWTRRFNHERMYANTSHASIHLLRFDWSSLTLYCFVTGKEKTSEGKDTDENDGDIIVGYASLLTLHLSDPLRLARLTLTVTLLIWLRTPIDDTSEPSPFSFQSNHDEVRRRAEGSPSTHSFFSLHPHRLSK